MVNSTFYQVLQRGLVKGPNTNPMRMFRASALGETLLMDLRLRPSISKVKDGRGSSQLTNLFFSAACLQIFSF